MTRKDYIALADALARAKKLCASDEQESGVDIAAIGICVALGKDNPRFDAERWYAHIDNS